MITITDAMNTVEFDDYFVITPNSEYLSWDRKKFLNESNKTQGKYCEDGFSYNSGTNKNFLTINELQDLIKNQIK